MVACSGKSSVLEGLTALPFPRDSGLCTRFATQITFRRAPQVKISISAIPPSHAEQQHRERLRAWKKENLQTLNRSEFAAVLQEVSCPASRPCDMFAAVFPIGWLGSH